MCETKKRNLTVAVVTSSRAEFGLLKGVINEILLQQLKLMLLVTGTHLSSAHGSTITEIEASGYEVSFCFDILENNPSPRIETVFAKTISLFGEFFSSHHPDIIVLLGDRYEILAVALAAAFGGIPIAHISGGDLTEGALDDAFRHSITKLSTLHFTSTEVYRKRVIQLGEMPDRVFNVGALGVENIKKLSLQTREELTKSIGFNLSQRFILSTYHPETASGSNVAIDIDNLLSALLTIGLPVLFTRSNADTGSDIINTKIEAYCKEHKDCLVVDSLGSNRYLNTMRYASAVVGNSSSAIVECPTFFVPVVNISSRQKGRVMSEAVINCDGDSVSILLAIEKALSPKHLNYIKSIENPYEGEDVAKKIVENIIRYIETNPNRLKSFYDIPFEVSI